MNNEFSRRDFLKLSTLGIANLAFRPFLNASERLESGNLARVASESVSVYSKPWDESNILYQRYQDELINIYYEVVSEQGPAHNSLWYRVWRGYIHSAHLQRVKFSFNPVLTSVPEGGQLGEITVPFTQAMRFSSYTGWQPVYRLYYQSTHWIVGIDEGPDDEPWYKLIDELLDIDYHAPVAHLRPIQPEEFAPISPEVPEGQKRIEVSIVNQTLTAYEDDTVALQTKISSGLPYRPPGKLSWNTPKGNYNIFSKMPSKHMGDGQLAADYDYELPGVPWVCFFEPDNGVATHGTYWHTNYGTPMSHGCVNMRTEEAKWLFRWTTPIAEPGDWEKRGYGTRVIVL